MGIKDLFKELKLIIRKGHLSQFEGKRVAVDGYGWLHKAAFGCCVKLGQGQSCTTTWINYCVQYIKMLLHHKIQVVMVFDGDSLPAKLATEVERGRCRAENLQKAKEYESRGDNSTAWNYYAKAVEVTPKMTAQLIAYLAQHYPQVECLVAPYEADAQLAYLTQTGYVDMVISEDSDNIPYGSTEVIFKLDRNGGCQYFLGKDLFQEEIGKLDLREFTFDMVVVMCILAGCDYVASLPRMGLKTSFNMVRRHRSANSVLNALRSEGKQLPLQYELEFYKAYATFNHQVVYDPRLEQTVHRTALQKDHLPDCLKLLYCHDNNQENNTIVLPFLGVLLDPHIATGIAKGLLDPITKEAFVL